MKRWYLFPALLVFGVLVYIIRTTNNGLVLAAIGFGVIFAALVLGGYVVHQSNLRAQREAVRTQKPSNTIDSPDGAVYRLEASTYDAGDPDEVMAVTVHRLGGNSIGNSWIFRSGRWQKLMKDRVLTGDPTPSILIGEINRLVQAKPEIGQDIHLKFAIMSLMSSATSFKG